MKDELKKNKSDTQVLKPNERMSHDYTDELELKSLLIRLKNKQIIEDLKCQDEIKPEYLEYIKNVQDLTHVEIQKRNSFINNDIKRYIRVKNILKSTSDNRARLRSIQDYLRNRIIQKSETVIQDEESRNQFGEIVILMVKNILRKQNFQFLDYHDDFYSDQSYKIFRYMRNFDHTKISERSGQTVNAFQYISQIIHNSIIFIINQRKKESDKITEFYQENPFSNTSFLSDENDDSDILLKLMKLCPLEYPFNIEDQYPFIIKDLLAFIDMNYNKESEETLIQRVLDYQETSKLGPTLVGDQIQSDEYLMKFLQRGDGIVKEMNW